MEWYQPVRARLIIAQVHLKLREMEDAKKAIRAARAWVPEQHDDLRLEMLRAETYLWLGDSGKSLAAIDQAIVLLEGCVQ